MIGVNFYDTAGNLLNTRQFDPGQEIKLIAHVTSDFGLPGAGLTFRFELICPSEADYYYDTHTTLWGNADVVWTLPNYATKAVVRVTAFWSIAIGTTEEEIYDIPIGVGMEPDPVVNPGSTNWIPLIIGAAVVGVVILIVMTNKSSSSPSVTYIEVPRGSQSNPRRRLHAKT